MCSYRSDSCWASRCLLSSVQSLLLSTVRRRLLTRSLSSPVDRSLSASPGFLLKLWNSAVSNIKTMVIKREAEGEMHQNADFMGCLLYLSLVLSLCLWSHSCCQLWLVALWLAGVSSSAPMLLTNQKNGNTLDFKGDNLKVDAELKTTNPFGVSHFKWEQSRQTISNYPCSIWIAFSVKQSVHGRAHERVDPNVFNSFICDIIFHQ